MLVSLPDNGTDNISSCAILRHSILTDTCLTLPLFMRASAASTIITPWVWCKPATTRSESGRSTNGDPIWVVNLNTNTWTSGKKF